MIYSNRILCTKIMCYRSGKVSRKFTKNILTDKPIIFRLNQKKIVLNKLFLHAITIFYKIW